VYIILGCIVKLVKLTQIDQSLKKIDESLVGSVMIRAEFGREDHRLIPQNCDWERAETT
jgi:hypothetical protein